MSAFESVDVNTKCVYRLSTAASTITSYKKFVLVILKFSVLKIIGHFKIIFDVF